VLSVFALRKEKDPPAAMIIKQERSRQCRRFTMFSKIAKDGRKGNVKAC
jgi:hypothetical protein